MTIAKRACPAGERRYRTARHRPSRNRRRSAGAGLPVVEVSLCGESGSAPPWLDRAGHMLEAGTSDDPDWRTTMRGLHVRRRAWPLAGVVSIALVGAAVATAATLTAGTPVQVADNPLAATAACAPLVAQQTAAGSVNFAGSEVEPYVAADPSNPAHLVASFQQDRWNDGGSNGLTNVVSTNGGADAGSLASSQPQFSKCAGAAAGSPGDFNRATDPWVSFSSDGKHRRTRSATRSTPMARRSAGRARSSSAARPTAAMTWQTPVTARARHVDHRAERQGDGDRRRDLAVDRVRHLGSARVSELARQPGRVQPLAGVPRPGDVLEDDRRRRDLEQRAA